MEAKPSNLGSWTRRTGRERPPDYTRTVRALTRDELLDEVDSGHGSPEYQQALRDEIDARSRG